MLQAVASPMMPRRPFAALTGLDATLVLSTLVLAQRSRRSLRAVRKSSSAPTLALPPVTLGLKLISILAGALVQSRSGAWSVSAAITRPKDKLERADILLVFGSWPVMSTWRADWPDRIPMLGLARHAFAAAYALLGLTALVFSRRRAGTAGVARAHASQPQYGADGRCDGNALPEVIGLFRVCSFDLSSPQTSARWRGRVLARSVRSMRTPAKMSRTAKP